jgi:hypothetical protein
MLVEHDASLSTTRYSVDGNGNLRALEASLWIQNSFLKQKHKGW